MFILLVLASSLLLRYSSIPTLNEAFLYKNTPLHPPAFKAVFAKPPHLNPTTQDSRKKLSNNQTPTKRNTATTQTIVNQWLRAVLKLHQQFNARTLDSCDNTCTFEKEVCQANNLSEWETLRTSDKLKSIPLFPNNKGVFPWERDYLSFPPLKDVRLLPSLTLSRVTFLRAESSKATDGYRVTCKKNERLKFRVDLVDDYGRARRRGGDDVRAWISTVGKKTRKNLNQLAATGWVKDLGNGSYEVAVSPKWDGIVKLNVAVVYPREYLRAALYHMKEGRHRFIFGQFKKSNITEVTICHTTPNIPGRPCVCNYTTWNRRPYYCGRPLDKRLSCADWSAIKSSKGSTLKDYTKAEEAMAATMSRYPDRATIKHNITIIATGNDTSQDPLLPCNKVKDKSVTWNHESPRGMWRSGKKWESFVCKEPPLTSKWAESCLKSTKIWMIGDSNLDQTDMSLRKAISLKQQKYRGLWSVERSAQNKNLSIERTFRAHEYPLFHYLASSWQNLLNQGGVEDFLGKIPSTGNHVVVIHYNLHFSISHLSAIFQRFLAVRQAVKDLLRRNPSVLVAIRGPHISAVEWSRNHLFGGDVQGIFILKLLHIVFEEMKHKIVFLDGWDMTISLKNANMHPSHVVPDAMVRTLLSFKCS